MPPLAAALLAFRAALLGPAPTCDDPVHVYAAGHLQRILCPEDARAAGMTIVDLGDAWAPYPLDGVARAAHAEPPAYRSAYVDLANARFADDPLAAADRYLELFGITPAFSIIHRYLDDEPRHRCHEAIDSAQAAALAAAAVPLRRESREQASARRQELTRQRALVAGALRRLGLQEPDELAARSPAYAAMVARLARAEARQRVADAIQAHLVCEGLLPAPKASGTFDYTTSEALRAYQRRQVIVASGELDEETRAALGTSSREHDLRLALRALRQRVVDAAGILEDGSARAEWGTVLGRQLDGADIRYQGGYEPLQNGAVDRVSPATEAAARALGWTTFEGARAFIHRHFEGPAPPPRFAFFLPPPPAYLAGPVELRAEIDRGDVWYEYSFSRSGARLAQPIERRPVLVLYARPARGGDEVALVRWPTTIGGWQEEKLPNSAVVHAYKGSDVGPRLWRDLVVAPVWYPPKSTPDDDLVRYRAGRWELKRDLLGPSYRSAYGMVMLIHDEPITRRGETKYLDHGIRTHGSVNYRSILTGQSHGCHRLYNHHALRLTSFILQHHAHVIRGPDTAQLHRKVRHKGHTFWLDLEDRGYYIELTPPIPVDVLEGRIMGAQKHPTASYRYFRR